MEQLDDWRCAVCRWFLGDDWRGDDCWLLLPGTELIGIAAGESENPEKNIPRAVRQVFWRILLFYVFAILIISLIIPYTDPSLLRNDVKDISVSPFTLVFQHAGLLSAAAVMNAVILTAVLSAGNSGMYASTRMLYTGL